MIYRCCRCISNRHVTAILVNHAAVWHRMNSSSSPYSSPIANSLSDRLLNLPKPVRGEVGTAYILHPTHMADFLAGNAEIKGFAGFGVTQRYEKVMGEHRRYCSGPCDGKAWDFDS